MSDQTTASATSNEATQVEAVSPETARVDKGKGKSRQEPEEDEEENDEDDEEEEEEEDDEDLDETLDEDNDDFGEIDPSNIVSTGRRRKAPLDYSSEEALKQAGLDQGAASADHEDEDADFKADDMEEE